MNEQSLKDRIKQIAKEKNIKINFCWKQLLLERFLARLSRSSHANKLIFKGGFLLSYLMKIGRETTDLDFLLTKMSAEKKDLQKVFEQIISIHSEDGFNFSFESIDLLSQPHMVYPGYRINLNVRFEKMKDKIQIDIGIGDIVNPLSQEISLIKYKGEPFFENSVSLLVYPVETIFSEKLETIISKGTSNSRMKDYHDLFLLIREKRILSSEKLRATIAKTFSRRGTIFRDINFDDSSLKVLQSYWAAHLRGLGDNAKDFDLPKEISVVINGINKFVDSIH